MPYIIILGIIFLNYAIPYKGVIELGEDENKILSQYKAFGSNSLNNLFSSKESALNNAIGESPTLTVLGDLNGNSSDSSAETTNDNNYQDIDISKYL